MRNIFIFILILTFHNVSAQKVAYFLPKKIIYVTVPFNIVEKKLFKVDRQTGQLASDPEKAVTTIKINGDIKVESKLFQDAIRTLDLEPLGKGGKSFNFDVTFDANGHGIVSTINASQTPVTSDIIKGTVNIVASVIKLATGVFGAVGGDEQPEFREITTEQNIEETRVIELTNNDPVSITIQPSTRVNMIAGPKPSVEVNITRIAKETIKSQNTPTSNEGIELHYRIPSEHSLQVIVKDNQLVKEQVVINERILVPQTGDEVVLLIPILKGKKTVDIGFDKETGNLSKYGIKKESQLSENTEAISNAIGSLNTEITGLKAALETKKEKEKEESKKKEEEEKQKEEDSKNKDLKDEIDRLKLEKDKLDLIIEKQNLQKELKEKKKQTKGSSS